MGRRRVLAPLACAVLVAAFVVDLIARPGGTDLTRAIDDLTELAAAITAAGFAGWRAHRSTGRHRSSWSLLASGCAAWGLGEAVWCWYALLADRPTPFPSIADAGFLAFPVLALAGLLVRPSTAFTGQGRPRVALDAALVSASLLIISWITVLGPVYRTGADSLFALLVSLAYPATDLVLVAVVVVVISFARTGDRRGLLWIAVGLCCLSFADSGFAYLTAVGRYGGVNVIDSGWVAGFLVIGVAALLDESPVQDTRQPVASRTALLLPYLPATAAIVVVIRQATERPLDLVTAAAGAVLASALVARQMSVLVDNRALMSRISHQAFHDGLTGLANRALFGDRLEHALELHRRDMRSVTVLLLDLDDFKTVNDSLGHPTGDELLVRASERIRATVRRGDTVARLGGDEFAILVEDGGDPVDTARRLLLGLDQPIAIGDRQLLVRASIGVATLDPGDPSLDATEVLKRADIAMYAAKRAGKARIVSYSSSLAGSDSQQLDMFSELVEDIAAGAIDVAFQPIHDVDGQLRGFEALARWSYLGEPVSPGVFLPAAARAGALARLDLVVLTQAVATAAGWSAPLSVSVNLSADSLHRPDLAGRILDVLRQHDVAAERLCVEILESSAIDHDAAALAAVAALRRAGIRIAVDDFGVGFASLSRLRALQPDIIKIDRSLICDEVDARNASPLLAGITHLAHRLGAVVVAEGVETDVQLGAAVAAECNAIQGFLWGRPMSAEACDALIHHRRPAIPPQVTAADA